jgi:hypothetical protein
MDLDSFWGTGDADAAALGSEAAASCVPCGRGSAALLAYRASETDAATRQDLRTDAPGSAGPPRVSESGGSGQLPGQHVGAPGSGGGGAGGAGFVLTGLGAMFAAAVLRWAKGLRLPTATWPPSAYVPPIESPG